MVGSPCTIASASQRRLTPSHNCRSVLARRRAIGQSERVVLAAVLAAFVWLVIAIVAFILIALVDEDVNHWEWEGDGPSLATNLRFVLYSALIATAIVGGAAFLLSLLWN